MSEIVVYNIKNTGINAPKCKMRDKSVDFINVFDDVLRRAEVYTYIIPEIPRKSLFRRFLESSSFRERSLCLRSDKVRVTIAFLLSRATFATSDHRSAFAIRGPYDLADVGHLYKNTRRALTETLFPRVAKAEEHAPYDALGVFPRSRCSARSKRISQTLERSRADFDSEGNAPQSCARVP